MNSLIRARTRSRVMWVYNTEWGISNATDDFNRSEENINDSALFFSQKMVTLDLLKTRATICMVIRSQQQL